MYLGSGSVSAHGSSECLAQRRVDQLSLRAQTCNENKWAELCIWSDFVAYFYNISLFRFVIITTRKWTVSDAFNIAFAALQTKLYVSK